MQAIAGWWDVYTHLRFGNADPAWNPAHLTLYLGMGVVALAAWKGLRTSGPSMSPVQFANLAGLKLAVVGLIFEGIAAVWNELVHNVFHNEPRIAPAHALLTLGMLIVNLGIVTGLSVEYGMIKREFLIVPAWKRTLTAVCVILTFSAIWLVAAGSFIYTARVFRATWIEALMLFMLALVATLVFVPAVRVLPHFGTVLSIALIFNFVAFVLLVSYAKVPPYVPFGLIPAVAFDFIIVALNRFVRFTHVALVASAFAGAGAYLLYFPYASFLFSELFSSRLGTLVAIAGSTSGCLLGISIYDGMSTAVLGKTLQQGYVSRCKLGS